MKISAVIAEYNPFHNGHKYLIQKMKENSDAVVCVMSGSFVQRGDVAIFDKWTRARSALMNGADIVLELPAVFSSATAERFAHGAVELISALGCVEELYFGSESGNIDEIMAAGKIVYAESMEVSEKIKKYLAKGYSFPSARIMAYEGKISSDLLGSSNNILAIEYAKAVYDLKADVKLRTLRRVGAGYHSTNAINEYASASALRNMIIKKESYVKYIPQNLSELYHVSDLYRLTNLSNTILYLLRSRTAEQIAVLNDVTEGLENRLIESSYKCSDIYTLADMASAKRYPKTRIQRILIALLLGIDKEIVKNTISYIRVLGFNDTGREIINIIKKQSALPIIIKTADFKEKTKMFEKDILSTDIAALCSYKNKPGGRDFTTPPVYLPSK